MTQRLDHMTVAPNAAKGFYATSVYLSQCGLPASLVDLVYLRVSQINGCAFCIDKHSRDLTALGMGIEKVLLVPVWREAEELFDEQERAALAWAEVVTRVAETEVPDAAFAAVSTVFSERQVVDLTMAVSLMNAYNRIGVSLRLIPQAVLKRTAAPGS